jgi:hypothetical protein
MSDKPDRVKIILQLFIEIGTRNGLGNNPAVKKLRDDEKTFALRGTYESSPVNNRIACGAAYQDILD